MKPYPDRVFLWQFYRSRSHSRTYSPIIVLTNLSTDENRMTSSATLDLSLQLLRQPSVTPIDHNCQKHYGGSFRKNWLQH